MNGLLFRKGVRSEARHLRPLAIALMLALPAAAFAQSSAERDREREQARIERDRETRQRNIERAQERAERDRERAQERAERERAGSLDTTVAFDARGAVTVTCPGGSVTVTGSSLNEIRVHARTENGAIRFSSSGTRATLEPASGRGCSDGQFDVTVPAGARVIAGTWSGSVTVRNVHGEIDVHSQSGDVDVRDAGDRLDVETLSGGVSVSGVRGESNIHTISGDLTLSGARGNVVVETVSGDLDLRDVIAKQVRTHTTSGEVTFQGPIIEGGRYEFNTHSGGIGLDLPPDIGAELSIATFSGGIESDFPITLTMGTHGIGAARAKRLTFTVGRGTARIVAETFSGDITLRRHR
ncbi:MAG TPA: DUF4097 family beta strand repeat-containing protein [Gemmatimonadaceae bacterium]